MGKTILAHRAFPQLPYVDLEDPRIATLFIDDPRLQITSRITQGIVLDEAQHIPGLFRSLRGMIDEHRQARGQFILPGSAQPSLVKGVSESLAGRVGIVELEPLTCHEMSGEIDNPVDTAWLKGGYPDAVLGDFREWHEAYLRTYVERDLPALGIEADPIFTRRLLTMLAHRQGGLLNANELANSLGVSHGRITRHLDIFEQTFLLRRLTPWHTNVGKRLTKSPKVYLRDTGLLHHLLNIDSWDALQNHPALGASWETLVIENLIRLESLERPHSRFHFWRTAAGAEVDLLVERGGRISHAIDIKAGAATPQHARRLAACAQDMQAGHAMLIDRAPGEDVLGMGIHRWAFHPAFALD